jgi:hypothetical protein
MAPPLILSGWAHTPFSAVRLRDDAPSLFTRHHGDRMARSDEESAVVLASVVSVMEGALLPGS